MSLQNIVPVYITFPKDSLLLRQMGHFTPILQHQQHPRHAFFLFFLFFLNFGCMVHTIVSRQMKCETYQIFNFFFNLRALYCTLNLFYLFDHLLNVAAQSTYLKSNMMRLCNEQAKVTYTYFPKRAPVCRKSDILISF